MSNSTYFLFGEDAVSAFNTGIQNEDGDELSGIEAVIYGDEQNRFSYETFEFIQGETQPTTLLRRYAGWGDWTAITKEEYDEI